MVSMLKETLFPLILLASIWMVWAKPSPILIPFPESNSFSFLRRRVSDYDTDMKKKLSEEYQDPEVQPGLWEGDIAPNADINWRLGLRFEIFQAKKWINGTVPYHISHKYNQRDRETIQAAIYTMNVMTCLDFVPYDGEAKDYLLIWPVEEPAGCWSFIGRIGGQQVLSLQPPDENGPKCLQGPGKAMHEILHALGIFHEQSRADRDDHVFMNPENVIKPFLHNFDKQSLENTTITQEYDYNSVMHYGTHFFSVGKDKPTLVPKVRGARIGQREGLSRRDCYKVNDLYGCFKRTPYEKIKYESMCDIMGL